MACVIDGINPHREGEILCVGKLGTADDRVVADTGQRKVLDVDAVLVLVGEKVAVDPVTGTLSAVELKASRTTVKVVTVNLEMGTSVGIAVGSVHSILCPRRGRVHLDGAARNGDMVRRIGALANHADAGITVGTIQDKVVEMVVGGIVVKADAPGGGVACAGNAVNDDLVGILLGGEGDCGGVAHPLDGGSGELHGRIVAGCETKYHMALQPAGVKHKVGFVQILEIIFRAADIVAARQRCAAGENGVAQRVVLLAVVG